MSNKADENNHWSDLVTVTILGETNPKHEVIFSIRMKCCRVQNAH